MKIVTDKKDLFHSKAVFLNLNAVFQLDKELTSVQSTDFHIKNIQK